MSILPALPYVAPVLPVAVTAFDHWYKWHKEKKPTHAHGAVVALVCSLFFAWTMIYLAAIQKQQQTAEFRQAFEVQLIKANQKAGEVRNQLSEQMRVQKQEAQNERAFQEQDQNARFTALAKQSGLIAAGCISDPTLRKNAANIHPELQRNATEQMGIFDQATTVTHKK